MKLTKEKKERNKFSLGIFILTHLSLKYGTLVTTPPVKTDFIRLSHEIVCYFLRGGRIQRPPRMSEARIKPIEIQE